MEININDAGIFAEHERAVLDAIMDAVGNDAVRTLDALHQLAAKVAVMAEVTPDSLVAGQARHLALLAGRN